MSIVDQAIVNCYMFKKHKMAPTKTNGMCSGVVLPYKKDGKWHLKRSKTCKQCELYHRYAKRTNFDVCCSSVEAMASIIDIAKVGWTKEDVKEWLKKKECEVPK